MQEQKTPQQNANHSKQVTAENYLNGQFLIAMPGLDDPYFSQSVTLLCLHDKDGCFGLTINKPLDITLDHVLKQINVDPQDIETHNPEPLTKNMHISQSAVRGGPVSPEQGFIIHDGDKKWENTLRVCDDLNVTSSQDILADISTGQGPEKFLFTLGCASWEANQLENEILDNAWLSTPINNDVIFDSPFDKRWQGAADILGINLHSLSGASGHD